VLRLVVDLMHNKLYNKSTTNRKSAANPRQVVRQFYSYIQQTNEQSKVSTCQNVVQFVLYDSLSKSTTNRTQGSLGLKNLRHLQMRRYAAHTWTAASWSRKIWVGTESRKFPTHEIEGARKISTLPLNSPPNGNFQPNILYIFGRKFSDKKNLSTG